MDQVSCWYNFDDIECTRKKTVNAQIDKAAVLTYDCTGIVPVRTTFGKKKPAWCLVYAGQTSLSSVINLSKTYGKITRPPDTGAGNICVLCGYS